MNTINIFLDMDGVLDKYKVLKRKDSKPLPIEFFMNLEPYQGLDVLNDFCGRYENIYIISKSVAKNSATGKRIWLKKHLPNLKDENVFITGGCKANVAQQALGRELTKNDILFDDYTLNLIEWENAGGRGIKRKNGRAKKFQELQVL